MTRKRNLNDEGITIENIFEELSGDFRVIYDELHNKLKGESKYKRLKRVGEEQFYNAPSESSIEMEHQNTRLCFAKINLLVLDVLKVIDEIIHEKFQENFVNQLKGKVLKAILKLYSEQVSETQEEAEDCKTSSSSGNFNAKMKEDEKVVLERLKDLICADNLIDIRKQVIEMPLEETEISATEDTKKKLSRESKMEEIDANNSKIDEENISIGSLSSVHTSDLSSFDDEVELSSDDEAEGKRYSMKEVEKRLAELKAEKLMAERKNQKQAKTTKHGKASRLEISANESSGVTQKTSSQRARKPNSKYVTDVILTPLRKSSTEKKTSNPAPSVDHSLPRKRGRPRKHLI